MKLSPNRGQKNHLNKSKGGVLPLLGVALIIVFVTAAVYFAAHYVAASYTQDNLLSNWSYQYTDQPGAVPEGELRIYNAQNPILTDGDVKKDSIYLTKLVDPSDKTVNITLVTDYAPMKIRVNGKDVYNNQFDKEDYVGNCYNAITLEPSTHERQIEVFMKLPFSVRFEAYLSNGQASALSVNAGFIVGAVIAGIGFLALLVLAILSAVRRRVLRSLAVAGIVTYVGVALMLHFLPEMTYLLNAPIWLRATEVPVHLTFLLTSVFLGKLFKNHRKLIAAIIGAAVLSAAAVLLSVTPTLVRISTIAMSVLTLAAILYTIQVVLVQLGHRTQYATPIFVIAVYYAIMATFATVLLISRQRFLYIYNVAGATFVAAGVLEFIFIQDYRFEKKNRELNVQSSRYENYVQYIAEFMRNMIVSEKPAAFFETSLTEMIGLLKQFQPENTAIAGCAALKTEQGYVEQVNNGVSGCDYSVIEENYKNCGKNCFFADTYFDCVICDDDKISAIFHFENISDGLDVFFMSMIEIAYCGLETTYEKIYMGDSARDINILFEELAENTELDNGCSVDHLLHICNYTRAMCLRAGMDEEKAEQIAVASKLHDIGKIAIPNYIIHKEARLSEEERVIINSHTEFGYTILSTYANDPLFNTAATIARYHHERYDGGGVNGLKGEEIPVEARIVTVCDVYDALVSERTYKKAWPLEDALNYLRENEKTMFDPVICEDFIQYIQEQAS